MLIHCWSLFGKTGLLSEVQGQVVSSHSKVCKKFLKLNQSDVMNQIILSSKNSYIVKVVNKESQRA